MTDKEAIEIIRGLLNGQLYDQRCGVRSYDDIRETKYRLALLHAVKALEVMTDVNQKVYRNENCDRKHKCYDYIGYHCAGCSASEENKK